MCVRVCRRRVVCCVAVLFLLCVCACDLFLPIPYRANDPGPALLHGHNGVWPLHDIAITNSLWRMVYKEGVGGGGRILRNSRV